MPYKRPFNRDSNDMRETIVKALKFRLISASKASEHVQKSLYTSIEKSCCRIYLIFYYYRLCLIFRVLFRYSHVSKYKQLHNLKKRTVLFWSELSVLFAQQPATPLS